MTESDKTSGTFETTPSELGRILQLLEGKGGQGKPPFPAIDLEVYGPSSDAGRTDALTTIRSIHKSKLDTANIRAEWYGARAEPGTSFTVATGEPDALLDYLGTDLFEPSAPIRVAYDGERTLKFSNGSRHASTTTIPLSGVARPSNLDMYVEGPGGLYVTSDPKKRPSKETATSWDAWVAAKYTVAEIPRETLASLLASGKILYGHGYTGAIFRVAVHTDGISVEIVDPKKPTADSITIEKLPGVKPIGGEFTEGDTFPLLYSSVEPLWASLRLLRCPSLTLVHHPAEKRVNLLAAEDLENGTPVLRFTQSFMSWSDPKANRPSVA